MSMKNLTVKAKLAVLCAIILAAFIVVNVISFVVMAQMNGSNAVISNKWMNAIISTEELNSDIKEYRLYEYKHICSSTETAKQDAVTMINTAKTKVDNLVRTCNQSAESKKEKQMAGSIKIGWNAYLGIHDQVLAQSEMNRTESAQEIMVSDSYDQYKTLHEICDKLVNYDKEQIKLASANSDSAYQSAKGLLIVADIVIVLLSFATEVYVIESITRPVKKMDKAAQRIAAGELDVSVDYQAKNELGSLVANFNKTAVQLNKYGNYIQEITSVLNEIASGNLDFHLTYDYKGEFAAVKDALNHLSTSLNDTLGQINLAADQVAGGANQVSSASQALSQGTTEQASSVEELAATINDISERVKSSAASARNASDKVNEVSGQLMGSNRQMQEMITAMGDISNSSEKIGRIIKTIEDIAFQTNILALNAAVEAAHAGEAGKGFAVVAEEVRNLASKSSEASKDTAQLIQTSLNAVEHGSKIANETAQSLTEVVEGTKVITDGIATFATTSKEQSVAIEQVTQGVEQVSSVIQTNTATSEESAAASEELSGQAQMLKNLVAQFKLSADGKEKLEAAVGSNAVSSVKGEPPASTPEAISDPYEDGFEEVSPSFVHDKY